MKSNLIITIGRENGSGGKYIGEKLATDLGIKCYDSKLITDISKNFNNNIKYVEKNDEKPPEGILYMGGQPIPSKIFEEQSSLIKKIASEESCIFIGRASDYVLKNHDNIVNVFVHAPLSFRIDRYSHRNNVSAIQAKKEIIKNDKRRSSFYKFYTSQNWGEAKNYNLCIDTSKVGIDGAIDIIKKYISIYNVNN